MARKGTHTLRWVCSKVHLYVGLALSLVLIVICVTGSALVFRGELDRLLRPDLLQVEDPGGPRLGPDRALQVVRDARPQTEPRLVELPQEATAPYKVWLTNGRHAFVDAYRPALLGTRGVHEGFMNTLFDLHAELLAGATGLVIVGVSGLLTLVLAVTGLVLWWPAGLSPGALRWRRLRVGLVVAWRRGAWRLNYDLHRAGGVYTLLFLALVAGTGSALVFYSQTGTLLNWVTGSRSLPPPPSVQAGSGGGPRSPSLDEAVRTARQEVPGAVPTFVYLPQAAEAPLSVRLRTPPEWHPNGRSFVYLRPRDGTVLRVDDMRNAPTGARLLPAVYPLHIGAVGGGIVRVLYVLLGLSPVALAVTGTLIWFRRWRKRHRSLPENGSAPPRPGSQASPGVRPAHLPDATLPSKEVGQGDA